MSPFDVQLGGGGAGFDTVSSVIGLVKDVQGVLPAGDKKDAIAESLVQAERQMQLAETQIAKGLGYALCECEFPPTPMLTVGRIERGSQRPVHR
ncbi:MAG: hypothetical protein WB509_19350 [Acetobacteraceae bacterium]